MPRFLPLAGITLCALVVLCHAQAPPMPPPPPPPPAGLGAGHAPQHQPPAFHAGANGLPDFSALGFGAPHAPRAPPPPPPPPPAGFGGWGQPQQQQQQQQQQHQRQAPHQQQQAPHQHHQQQYGYPPNPYANMQMPPGYPPNPYAQAQAAPNAQYLQMQAAMQAQMQAQMQAMMAQQLQQQQQAASVAQARQSRGKRFVILGNFLPRQLTVVRKGFQHQGYRETKRDDPLGWDCAWGTGGALKRSEYASLEPHQRFNHFPCTHQLGNKDLLWKNLDRARASTGEEGGFDFFPRTFVLPDDLPTLRYFWEQDPEQVFILKPKYLARGEGIKLVRSEAELPEPDKQKKFIVQQYLDKPFLVNKRKHTLRIYVAATSIDPLRVYMLEDGFVHVATEPYTNDPERFGEIRVHVTNPDVQGNLYWSKGGGANYHNLTSFKNLLKEAGDPNLAPEVVWPRIEDVLVKTLLAAQQPIGDCVRQYSRPRVSFEVWGFDVMVDDEGKPWIIEVNHTPSTNTDFKASKEIKSWMVRDLLAMAAPTDTQRAKWRRGVELRMEKIGWDKNAIPRSAFEEIVDMETEFNVAKEGHYKRIFPRASRSYESPHGEFSYADELQLAWAKAWAVDAAAAAKAE